MTEKELIQIIKNLEIMKEKVKNEEEKTFHLKMINFFNNRLILIRKKK